MGVSWIQPWASRAVVVAVGVTVAAIGNQLPRTRPNMAIGIRTARTLSDRKLWMLTYRTTGYLAVALGSVTIFAALFLHGDRIAAIPFISFMAVSGYSNRV
jgi:uncharacterized membrane protein